MADRSSLSLGFQARRANMTKRMQYLVTPIPTVQHHHQRIGVSEPAFKNYGLGYCSRGAQERRSTHCVAGSFRASIA